MSPIGQSKQQAATRLHVYLWIWASPSAAIVQALPTRWLHVSEREASGGDVDKRSLMIKTLQ
jgi:hypothetical protein